MLFSGTDIKTVIISILISLPSILLALSAHEASHALAAHLLGDDTARNYGRLTLDPFKHIDIVGLICLLLFRFGWAKPVPVSSRYLKRPKLDLALIALAGPFANLILGFIGVMLYYLCAVIFKSFDVAGSLALSIFFEFIIGFIQINIGLAVFNIIPIPPLDGSRLLGIIIPRKWSVWFFKYERYITIVILILLYLSFFNRYLNVARGFIIGLFESAARFVFGL